MSPIFPDCYDEWSLERLTYDLEIGYKSYETLYEGTEEDCRDYAFNNFNPVEQAQMCLMDWEGREWNV